MNITPIQNNYQQKFGSYNIIQVSKSAFKNPEDAILAYKEFNRAVNKTTREVNNFIGTIFTLIGKGNKTNKTFTYLEESPAYPLIMNHLKKSGNFSISWLSQNTEIPITEPLSPNHHSFTILTKKQKDEASPLFSGRKFFELIKTTTSEVTQKINNNPKIKIDQNWANARMNQLYAEQIKPIIEGEPVHKFVINDFSELPEIFKQIDY